MHSLLLVPIPDGTPLLIGAAWTLSHEFLFYAVFVLMILFGRAGMLVFALWLGAIVLCWAAGGARYPVDVLLAPCNLLFVMGILAGLWFPKLSRRGALLCAGLGVAGFLAVGWGDLFKLVAISHALRTVLPPLAALAVLVAASVAVGGARTCPCREAADPRVAARDPDLTARSAGAGRRLSRSRARASSRGTPRAARRSAWAQASASSRRSSAG